MEVDAQRARALIGEPFPVNGEGTRPGGQSGGGLEQLGLDLGSGQPRTGGAIALDRLPPGAIGRGQQILALGHEQPRALTPAPPLSELADLLELVVVGA